MTEKVFQILEKTATEGKTIHYADLIRQTSEKKGIYALIHTLHKICSKTVKKEGFMLGAVVVSKKTGMPSEGFFKYAQKLYKIELNTEEEKLKFWKNELEKIYRRYKD
ncbi:hypothetical protein [Persephonella sp.]